MSNLFSQIKSIAKKEKKEVMVISAFVGASALSAGFKLGKEHVFDYYVETVQKINSKGFLRYFYSTFQPYINGARSHFDPQNKSYTEDFLTKNKT
jgi:hypothetical protein